MSEPGEQAMTLSLDTWPFSHTPLPSGMKGWLYVHISGTAAAIP